MNYFVPPVPRSELGLIVNNAAQPHQQFRVNLSTVVQPSLIREELYNNRLFIVLPSKTLPDNIVMNDMLYPASEIAASFKGLEGTPAPLGHPVVNGEYVPATHPEAYLFSVGALNKNVRRENGSVYIEKWIDKAYAQQVAPELMAAINEGKPISTSTGLLCDRYPVIGKAYSFEARNMRFDHDAILLHETPAAGIEQGVGMLINQQFVINAVLDQSEADKREALALALPEEAWIIDYDDDTLIYSDANGKKMAVPYEVKDGVAILTGEHYTVKRKTKWERFKEALTPSSPVQVNKMDEELKAMLTANAAAAEANATAIAELSGAVAKVAATMDAIQGEQIKLAEATTNAALADKRAVVAATLGETVANALSGEALDAALAKCQPSAAPILAGLHTNTADDLASYEKE